MDILSFGIIVTDMIIKPVTPELFQRDDTLVDFTTHPGGDGCNVCLNAAAMGMEAALVTAVGEDALSGFLRGYLEGHGVDTSYVAGLPDCPTGVSFVLTQPDGERHFLTSVDILDRIDPDQVTDDMLAKTKFLTVNSFFALPRMEGERGTALMKRAKEMGVRTALDTIPCKAGHVFDSIFDVLPYTDIFIPSYEEAVAITGKETPEEMAAAMQKFGFDIFGVKLGSDGCFVTDYKDSFRIPAANVPRVVSTVGAGDTFFAGFITAQVRGMGLRDSALFATAAASLTVQVPGASGGVKSFDQVDAVFRELRDAL